MKATDFDLSRDMKLSSKSGVISFASSRLVLFDANSIGLLRQKLLEGIGRDKTRSVFLKFGYQSGYSDFLQMKLAYQFDTEMDLLASGPVIHSWEGIVQAEPIDIRFDRKTGDFFFTGAWNNSYEAEQYLSFNEPSTEPVCWTLMGYASGWCSAFFGRRLVAIEPACAGKGDPRCEWKIQPEKAWGAEAAPYIEAYKEFAA